VLVSTLIVAAVPAGGDAAAHLYRTLLVHSGTFVWDNLWFSGQGRRGQVCRRDGPPAGGDGRTA
jgi:hypothetical protein